MADARDALERLRVREPEIVAEARLTAAVTPDA
jgi:hypothetical protein